MGARQRRAAQQADAGEQVPSPNSAPDRHDSTSTSTATAVPTPSLLELAAREWDAASGGAAEAGTAWADAGDAILFPADHQRLLTASVTARIALEGISSHQREARAYHLGVPSEQKPESDTLQKQGSDAMHAALHTALAHWNERVLRTRLGQPYLVPPAQLETVAAVFERVWDGAWDLALQAAWVREKSAKVPAVRPPDAPAGLDLLRSYQGNNAALLLLDDLLVSLDGHYGHEWQFLFDEAKRAGLPKWAEDDLNVAVGGAAEYEGRLQDEGRLEIDDQKIDRLARQIRRAADGWGTKESQLMVAELRNLTRPEREELERIYRIRFGVPMVVQLDSEVKGEDDTELFTALSGDPIRAAIAALENRIDGDLVDPDEIVAVLRTIPASERARFQEMRKSDPTLITLERRILSAAYLDDRARPRDPQRQDQRLLAAWFGTDRGAAESLSMEESARGAEYGQGNVLTAKWAELAGQDVLVPDLKRMVAELDRSEDPRAVEAAFDRTHPYTLRQWIGTADDAAQRDLALALLDKTAAQVAAGEKSPAEVAARVMVGSDAQVLTALTDPDLESDDPVKQARARQRRADTDQLFAKRYGQMWELPGNALSNRLRRRFKDEDDREQALHHYQHGKQRDAIVAWKAIYELGTKEEKLKDLFRGKSKAEMDALRKDFGRYTGRDLDEEIDDETWDGSDDAFDLQLLAHGSPETEEEARAYARLRQSRHRGGGAAQGATDWVEENLFDGHSGPDADRQFAMIDAMFDPATGKVRPGVDPKVLRRVYDWHVGAIEDHQAAKAMVIDAIANGVQILVAALVTVLSGGGAAPWLVAALSAVAGVATKAVLSGSSTTFATVAVDVVVGLASIAMAGIGARILAGGKAAGQGMRTLAIMAEDAAQVGGKALREQVIRKAMALIVENGGNAAVGTALADGTWDQGLDAGFLAIVGSALRDAGVSLVTFDLAPEKFQSRIGSFLVQTGTQWIVQSPDDMERTAFVIHSVLRAGSSAAEWGATRKTDDGLERRSDQARKRAETLDPADRQKVRAAMQAELDRAMTDPNLSDTVKERLRAWLDQYDARDLAFDASTGSMADDALTRPPQSAAGPETQRQVVDPLWNLRHTGQKAWHEGKVWVVLSNEPDHFVLMRNKDGAMEIVTVDSKKLLEGDVNSHLIDALPETAVSMAFEGTDHRGATKMYDTMIGDDPLREAAIYYNPETGEYITVQGEGRTVEVAPGQSPAPGGIYQSWKELLSADVGAWVLIRHYHPVHDPAQARLMQFPSDGWGDMGIVRALGTYYGEISTSLIDTMAPWGEPTSTSYGYDPHTGAYFVEWEQSKGNRVRKDFPKLEDYHKFLADQGGAHNPVPGPNALPTAQDATGKPPRSAELDPAVHAKLSTLAPELVGRLSADLGPDLLATLSRALGPAQIVALHAALGRERVAAMRAALGDNVLVRLFAVTEPAALVALSNATLQAPLADYLTRLGDKFVPLGAAALVTLGTSLDPEALADMVRPWKIDQLPYLATTVAHGGIGGAIGHFGSAAALGGLLHDAHGAGLRAETARRLIDQCVQLGWKDRLTLGSFMLEANGAWEEAMTQAEVFHRVGNRFAARPAIEGSLSGGTAVHTATVGGVTLVATDNDLAHYKSGHTFEAYALTMANARRGSESSLWPAGTSDATILADLRVVLATPEVEAAARAATARETVEVGGYFVGLSRVDGVLRVAQFYPSPGRPGIPKAAMRGIVKLFESM